MAVSDKHFNITLEYLLDNIALIRNNVAEVKFKNNIDEKLSAQMCAASIGNKLNINLDENITSFILSSYFTEKNTSLLALLIDNDKSLTVEKRLSVHNDIQTIFNSIPDFNETALLQVYDQYGETGLKIIYDIFQRDKDLFKKQLFFGMIRHSITHQTISGCNRSDYGFTPEQRVVGYTI